MRLIFLFISLSFCFSLYSQKQIDLEKSNIKWYGKKISGGGHYGTIKFIAGALNFEGSKIIEGEFIADLNTINVEDISGNGKNRLENHLKSEDFFSVSKYSTANLIISESAILESGSYNVIGNLTIRGITHGVKFKIEPLNKNSYTAKLTFNRAKYDVKHGSGSFFKNLGDKLILDDIDLEVKIILN